MPLDRSLTWEAAPYASFAQSRFVDVDGTRLYVKQGHSLFRGKRQFTGHINGKWVGSWGAIEVACERVEEIYQKRAAQ